MNQKHERGRAVKESSWSIGFTIMQTICNLVLTYVIVSLSYQNLQLRVALDSAEQQIEAAVRTRTGAIDQAYSCVRRAK